MVDDFRRAVDNKKVILAVAIAYSVAFDCVNVALLIKKLEKLGFFDSANKWIRSFLTNRTQVVSSPSGEVSTSATRNTGMPQGILNGPGFFGLYINDSPAALKHCKHHLYADDLTIYYSGSYNELDSIIDCVNADLSSLALWATENGLLMNARKTQAIWFGTRNFITKLRHLNLPEPAIEGHSILGHCQNTRFYFK